MQASLIFQVSQQRYEAKGVKSQHALTPGTPLRADMDREVLVNVAMAVLSGRMIATVARISILSLGFVFAARAQAGDAQTVQDGLTVKIGNNQVELRVATPHAFRLHIFPLGAPSPVPSIFLTGAAQPATPFTVTHDGSAVGIKTSFGELKVDPDGPGWSVMDAAGSVIARGDAWKVAAPAGEVEDKPGTSTIGWAPGVTSASPVRFYGSGSGPHLGDLVQTESPGTMTGNWMSLPQVWSTSGCGALLVSDRNDQPASWKSGPDGGVKWSVPGRGIDLYIIPASTLADWLQAQAELTGFAPVPPKWSLGYLQSRWGWKDKDDISDTLSHFRNDNLPVDAFIFDFEWYTKTPDYSVPPQGLADFIDFGWNPVLFPDPAPQIDKFARNGLHLVGIRKPRLGSSDNLAMAKARGWTLPGKGASFSYEQRDLDFSNAAARNWYEDQMQPFDVAGMAGFWNDEGELRYDEYSFWNLAEYDLLKRVRPDARFWSLNRSFAPGMQRFGAATWTGDIGAQWPTLEKTPGQLLAQGLSGMPYSTCDIGGFTGRPSPELMVRWMEAGVFFPIMRCHSVIDQPPHFPWLYGSEAEDAIRKALDLRYRLLPYYYSLAHANYQTAVPLMRPLIMEFPKDEKVANETDEWLMGPGLLAAPVLRAGGARQVYLPADDWFGFGTNQITKGSQTVSVNEALDQIAIYVRAGTLLPLGPVIQDVEATSTEPLEMQIYPGHNAAFDLVEDDGNTLAYQRGVVRITHFVWDDHARKLSWKIDGSYDGGSRFRAVKAVLFAPQSQIAKEEVLQNDGRIDF